MYVDGNNRIVLGEKPSTIAKLVREFDGKWELILYVDAPDDLNIVKIDPASFRYLDTLLGYLR